MMLRRVFAALTTLALLGAACNGDDDDAATPITTTSTTAASTSSTAAGTSSGATCALEGGSLEAQRSEGEGGPLFLESIEHVALEDACAEQVAFRIEEPEGVGRVAYDVGYSAGPFEDPGGRVAVVEGEAFLRVVLLNASTVDLSGNEPRETLTFEDQPSEDAIVKDIVKVSDFEGVSEWVIGLDVRRPFTAEYDEGGRLFLVKISAA